MKQEIRESLRLVASVGVAPNKFLAKIASDLDKPDGLTVVDPNRVQEFLAPLPVGRLWGVGRVTGRALEQLGVGTIGQLRRLSLDELQQRFGKSGEHLWELAHGIDDRAVIPDRDAKSISHETTFPADIEDPDVLRACLLDLTEQVARRLRQQSLRGRVVQIKLRFADFRTITRSRKLPQSTDSTDILWHAASTLLATSLTGPRLPLRLLGMGVSGIEHLQLSQGTLFDDPQDHSQLDAVADTIRDRFGTDAIQRGSSLGGGTSSETETR